MATNRITSRYRKTVALIAIGLISGCSSGPKSNQSSSDLFGSPSLYTGRGGYYQDDGPHKNVPANLEATPDAIPRIEPYRRSNSRPYRVQGKTYTPITHNQPFTQRGVGSWYGKKFHGRRTASGEYYDMYKMTAAHPTLPIPSYARVTNLRNGRQVIVRINDRGPFHSGRIIDLSYTAALKLGYINKGRENVQVDRLLPIDIRRMQQARMHPSTSQQVVANNRKTPEVSKGEPQLKQHTSVQDHSEQNMVLSEGFHLQLGAFSQKYYAENMRAQYASYWAGKLPPATVVRKEAMYHLYAGPFANSKLAADAARQIQLSGMAKPLIVQH